jgi:Holliday junction resolvase
MRALWKYYGAYLLSAASNRRHGARNEGGFLQWLRARGHVAIHLSPSHSAGDVVAWIGSLCYIFEAKRVDLSKNRSYRFSKNRKQHAALQALVNRMAGRAVVLYAISFKNPDQTTTTRFVSPFHPEPTVGPLSGWSWEEMGLT